MPDALYAGVILAAADPGCQIVGIGCIFGNTDVNQVARNVFRVLTLCGRPQIPVFIGSAEPLVAEPIPSNYWFGRDGLGDAAQVHDTVDQPLCTCFAGSRALEPLLASYSMLSPCQATALQQHQQLYGVQRDRGVLYRF